MFRFHEILLVQFFCSLKNQMSHILYWPSSQKQKGPPFQRKVKETMYFMKLYTFYPEKNMISICYIQWQLRNKYQIIINF